MTAVALVLEHGVRDDLVPSAMRAAEAVERAITSVARGVVGVAERTEAVEALLAGKFARVCIKGAHAAFSCADTIGSYATSDPASALESQVFSAPIADQASLNDGSASRVSRILCGSAEVVAA